MDKNSFHCDIQIDENTAIALVTLSGAVDAHNAPELERQLLEALQENVTSLIIDLSALEYISSAGLGVFMVISDLVQKRNGQLLFAALPATIRTILETLGFHHLFPLFGTVQEAWEFLVQPRSHLQ